ncbi:inner centromere protein A-like isoform X2 [Adelges cooleyi]|uniref:inner centromere protein A-like isoform X2 n=1 Tax=Adelges cooleyi TaxID=133065 RepID=UPI00217F72CB|nr:inner centromere protein A-like isoform X2 [Adelges cooleyi]
MEQSMNMLAIWKDLAQLTQNCFKDIQNCFEQQTLKLDVVYNDFLTSVQKDPTLYAPEIKTSKRQSKAKKSNIGDLFCEPSFQPPAIPPVRRTKRQASIAAAGKMKSLRKSSGISSSTRASRARAISTLMDITTMDFPKANSTFVASKKCNDNIEECLSPQLFSPENQNETYIKPSNPNETYKLTNENSNTTTTKEIKQTTKKKSAVSKKKSSKKRSSSDSAINVESISESNQTSSSKEKSEDNNSNVEETTSLHMTRTKKRKIEKEEQNTVNVIRVPLEKQVTLLAKPIEVAQPTIHDKVNEAEKRKEKYLKSKADQTKFDEQHLKVAKQREEQFKRIEEKLKKAAEDKKIKEEKQREKELLIKERALQKQKQAELRLAEINAKRKQAEELKLMKLQKAEAERLAKIKENETKKIEKFIPISLKTTQSNLPKPLPIKPTVPLKSKINQIKKLVTSDDYGLNDISARDSSEDESGPKKPVPDWAKRGNRKVVLELQYHIDSKSRDLFFDCPKQFSLKEMFKGWNIRDRQRTSSAVWNTPIRYSEYLRKH